MMKEYKVTAERISAFGTYLLAQERVAGTREKYLRDLRAFAAFLDGQSVTKERAADWKEHLLNAGDLHWRAGPFGGGKRVGCLELENGCAPLSGRYCRAWRRRNFRIHRNAL